MNRTEKQQEIDSLKQGWEGVSNAYFVDYRGLTVAQLGDLRRKIRDTGSSCRVVKNRLGILAARETALKPLEKWFDGMTAIAWNTTEPTALARVIRDFTKDSPLVFKAGLVEGKPIEANQLEMITNLPSRPELIGMFAGMLLSPVRTFAGLLKAPMRDLASVLRQVSEKKGS